MIETRSAATALNKHKALQQFFKWLMLDEEEIEQSPMPPHNGRSLASRHSHPTRDVSVTRHQQEFPGSRPSGPFPHL